MNNVLILDLTANHLGWEFNSAQKQERALHNLGLKVFLEKFEELTECLGQNESSPNNPAHTSYDIQNKFHEKCKEINLLLDQIDYVNIRCHGQYENGHGYADLFCSKNRQLGNFEVIANFEILLQLIPNLKSKDIFFTICHGGHAIQPFIFNGLTPNNQNYIFSLEPVLDNFSLKALTYYIRRQLANGESPRESFDHLFNSIKTDLYSLNKDDRKLLLRNWKKISPELAEDNNWKKYIDSILVNYLYMENPSEIFETFSEQCHQQ